jgi:hypothetical protein
MNTKNYLIVSTLIFAVVAVMHLFRLMMDWSLQLGTYSVPFWMSGLALLVSAVVAIWGLMLVRRV